ncbi:2-hydroxyhepta-2,4-diene-1,7-dioate isomerase [Natronococcus pandeyae]|uniref:2-hydroxyhepta-2,4-diene-1,7-dioate isomerase n=1 Tax=Natronococcus pandeyae TaxID=2055836 RepID=A0A8J8TRW6_9EURY|nr:fumarylacetoacetate hydrolase family protein [Natronococcus pandeyae]TYL37957.1 2-hydroxyhepta-2,4-diene-1,7-dioate isomerase [Natronococcus pandeyae]
MRTVRFSDPSGLTRTGAWTDSGIEAGNRRYDPDEVTLLPPSDPTKIVCQAGGYMDHREESGFDDLPDRPELFLKTPNCLVGHGDAIELPPGRDDVEFEAEFGIVIDEQCREVSEDEAMDVVRGFTCVNDISNRDDQAEERNWVRGKAFDASLPMGPVLATPDEVPDDARLELRLNGEVKQETTREMMIFSVPELVAEVTELITLEPGDVIASGTPFGPGPLEPGDVVEVEFEGVGTLENHVVER